MGGEGSGDVVGHEFRGNQWSGGGTADRVAKTRMERAREIEPVFTKDITETASATGGKAVGLNYKLKEESSLLKKIQDDSIEKKITPDAAAEQMTDLNRYTITYPNDENFTGKVKSAQNELKNRGYKPYQDKQKKYYRSNTEYIGYNTVMQKGNDVVEIQFHTPESYRTKEGIHGIYKGYDKSNMLSRYEAHTKMVKIWSHVKAVPVGWQNLEGRLI